MRHRPTPEVRADTADTGFTLIELLVAMFVFTVVMTLVFSNLESVVQGEGRVESTATASAQVDAAFMQLDSEVRYASDINQPSSTGGDYFVEFQSDWTSTTTVQSPTCTQVEYDSQAGTLQQRTWLPGETLAGHWQVMASDLDKSPTVAPFALSTLPPSLATTPPTSTSGQSDSTAITPWQLTVKLTAAVGYGPTAETSDSSFTITALNIDTTTDTGVCTP